MTLAWLLPVILSALVLAAHFLRGAHDAWVALCLAAPFLLLVRRRWVPAVLQSGLALGTLVWLRTLLVFVRERQARGEPWTRLVFILGGVALFTLASALVFRIPRLRRRYAPRS